MFSIICTSVMDKCENRVKKPVYLSVTPSISRYACHDLMTDGQAPIRHTPTARHHWKSSANIPSRSSGHAVAKNKVEPIGANATSDSRNIVGLRFRQPFVGGLRKVPLPSPRDSCHVLCAVIWRVPED